MDMKPGEIVDRWTILRMKLRAQPDNNSVLGLTIAHGTASEQILSIGDPNLLDLVEINAKIWTLESMGFKLRTTSPLIELHGSSLHMAAQIAQEITALNKMRVAAIERINLQGELNAKVEEGQDGASEGK